MTAKATFEDIIDSGVASARSLVLGLLWVAYTWPFLYYIYTVYLLILLVSVVQIWSPYRGVGDNPYCIKH